MPIHTKFNLRLKNKGFLVMLSEPCLKFGFPNRLEESGVAQLDKVTCKIKINNL